MARRIESLADDTAASTPADCGWEDTVIRRLRRRVREFDPDKD